MGDTMDIRYINDLMREYTSKCGLSQFSYYRFACYLMEKHPDIAASIIEDSILKNISKSL
jgi:hypothetical protein